jgi:hypothetical protein
LTLPAIALRTASFIAARGLLKSPARELGIKSEAVTRFVHHEVDPGNAIAVERIQVPRDVGGLIILRLGVNLADQEWPVARGARIGAG